VLSKFDEGPDLVLYYKELMVLEGNEKYAYQINSSDQLTPPQKSFLHQQWKVFKKWWSEWPGSK
jgi:4-hydroxy-tetrahydrodipicolinate synthase